jgi:transglutaminase-like putative cysteine protease
MTRAISLVILALFAMASRAMAQAGDAAIASPPFEIVKQDIEVEAAPGGQSWEFAEISLRPLTAQGVKALQQRTLTYTQGYQQLDVDAYTLKKDGRKIFIPPGDILQGHGETTSPGFEDTRTMTIVFPSLEVGDQAVLLTRTVQLVPWFPNVFASMEVFSKAVVVRDARFVFTSRGDDGRYHIVTSQVEAEAPVTLGGKTRHVWRFHNDTPIKPEPGAVEEYADRPRVEITSLSDYSDVARIYADIFHDRAEVTPEISELAKKLTVGITDRRAKAKALYDWVATHIEYVNIVLGAGGFLPHKASDVLKNGYGDCKDHVMLLQALLAAEGIRSSAVLIRAAGDQFELPSASPFLFDHLISYLPEFKLYLDSTARYAPFGVLPVSDAGKRVVIVEARKADQTPPDTASASSISVDSTITLNSDGSADGDSKIHATGTDAIGTRAVMASLPLDGDTEFFRAALGPGSDGKFTRGKPEDLTEDYEYSAHFHQGHVANFPGPGAVSILMGNKPFSFAQLIGSELPPSRTLDYVCVSGTYRDTTTIGFPQAVAVSKLPPDRDIKVEGAELQARYQLTSQNAVRAELILVLKRPGPVCRAANWATVRPILSNMSNALFAQILYQ